MQTSAAEGVGGPFAGATGEEEFGLATCLIADARTLYVEQPKGKLATAAEVDAFLRKAPKVTCLAGLHVTAFSFQRKNA